MTIEPMTDSLTASRRLLYMEEPDEGFFRAYMAAYATYESGPEPNAEGASATERLLADLPGQAHTDLSRRRGLSQDDQAAYADILNRAYLEGGMLDPVGFLKSLSSAELAVVQRNHALADPISPSTLSREGAFNLLLPEGYGVDFNQDDLIEVGIGRTIKFPPADAPAEFLDAWFEATRGMSERDAGTYALVMYSAMHSVALGDQPMGRTLPGASMASYRAVVVDYLEMLEHPMGELAPGQYERDKAFFTRLRDLLG